MKFWTGIGSRDIPDDIYELMVKVSSRMATKGYILRSGAAEGSDTAAQEGTALVDPELTEIWIPWKKFRPEKKLEEFRYCNYLLPSDKMFEKAKEFFMNPTERYPRGIIAWFDKMSKPSQKLHGRNYYQIIGKGKLSDVCIYAAPETSNGSIKGGTRSAVETARHFKIPTYNLLIDEQRDKICKILDVE